MWHFCREIMILFICIRIDWLWYCGTVVLWCRGAVVPWCRGALVPWCRGAVVAWCRGTVVLWCLIDCLWYCGAVVLWCLIDCLWYCGTVVPWCRGTMVLRRRGAAVPRCHGTVALCYCGTVIEMIWRCTYLSSVFQDCAAADGELRREYVVCRPVQHRSVLQPLDSQTHHGSTATRVHPPAALHGHGAMG